MDATHYPPPAPHTQGLPRRAARPGPSPRVAQNRAFAWGLVAGFVLALLIAWTLVIASDEAIPPCTDEVAVSGGVCQGPLVDGAGR